MQYTNIFSKEDNNKPVKEFWFNCRGAKMKEMKACWDKIQKDSDYTNETYLFLENDPDNFYDSEAIAVKVAGRYNGILGYVGREYIRDVRKILENCEKYKLELDDEHGMSYIRIRLLWTEN